MKYELKKRYCKFNYSAKYYWPNLEGLLAHATLSIVLGLDAIDASNTYQCG